MASPIEVHATSEAIQKPLRPASILNKFKGHKYAPSPTGVDSNLLILLHGLGDSSQPFFQLALTLQKTLPQTAVLSLQAPYLLPFLEGEHWMWWPTFDQFGEMLTAPNPTKTVADLIALLDHLTAPAGEGHSGCGWDARTIHFFGFGQGATCVLETLVQWTKARADSLGSVVSISGEFVSHPTINPPSQTQIFHIYRSNKALSDSAKFGSFRKASKNFTSHRLELAPGNVDEAMPRNKSEWDPIMQFWAKLFRYRSTWELKGEAVSI